MIERRPITAALAVLLATATGKPCGTGTLPRTPAGATVAPPYTVLQPLDFDVSGAPFTDLSEDAEAIYQVTCVATTTEQAEWLSDRVRKGVLGRDPVTRQWLHPIDVPGVACRSRESESDAGTDNTPGDAIVSYVIRFRIAFTTRNA